MITLSIMLVLTAMLIIIGGISVLEKIHDCTKGKIRILLMALTCILTSILAGASPMFVMKLLIITNYLGIV